MPTLHNLPFVLFFTKYLTKRYCFARFINSNGFTNMLKAYLPIFRSWTEISLVGLGISNPTLRPMTILTIDFWVRRRAFWKIPPSLPFNKGIMMSFVRTLYKGKDFIPNEFNEELFNPPKMNLNIFFTLSPIHIFHI